ncbi:ATP-binding protein [Cupriavidus basilensis]|uniref:histidine kinase n=1 Tax=Cupriavidus basilensis TaxID=68895 RepID=A0ABT6AMF8_9BURK|nr:ATP-binding protein [Cupriavidus basilensis]MDF3833762.1 ATP-binding protein [Cupriavidus basilensis]
MKLVGLSRQIVLSMMAIALGVTLLVILTSYAFYFLWRIYWPEQACEDSWIPTGPEWVWMIGATICGLALAVVVAVNLSRRILVPLNSVADSIRRMAQGDLDARAVAGDRSLGEASQLADDFNALANQLQRVTEEQAFWNAAIAHELRTPVTILRGRLQGLAEGVFMPDESQFRSLLAQVEGLGRLIEDLRVVSLAESGHLHLQVREANLAAEANAVVDMVGDALQARGQRAILELDTQPVRCDPVRMRQALLALLDNVRRYAVPGQVRIQSHAKNGWCELSVEDDGPGVPEDFIPHAFTAFRRAEGARSGGSGLGLAVVAAIARAHGGHAECRKAAGGGTVFTLIWPDLPETGLPGSNRSGRA